MKFLLFYIFFPVLNEHFYDWYFELFQVNHLPLLMAFSGDFYFIHLSGNIYSCVSLFSLAFHVIFYTLDRTATSPRLGDDTYCSALP